MGCAREGSRETEYARYPRNRIALFKHGTEIRIYSFTANRLASSSLSPKCTMPTVVECRCPLYCDTLYALRSTTVNITLYSDVSKAVLAYGGEAPNETDRASQETLQDKLVNRK
jgi:hypothetical protein